jgi:predicted metal-dependent hydrolase
VQNFNFTVKKSKGRYLRIQIKPGGTVVVFKPAFFPMILVNKFLKEKEGWILEKIEKQKTTPPNLPLQRGGSRVQYKNNKEAARRIVEEKLKFWKTFYKENFGINFFYNKVAIKNTKTRWGSCSSKKNLNFSYKIFELPNELQDYLIVHELCHLQHMNHSKSFWQAVSLGIPNFIQTRKMLRKINLWASL